MGASQPHGAGGTILTGDDPLRPGVEAAERIGEGVDRPVKPFDQFRPSSGNLVFESGVTDPGQVRVTPRMPANLPAGLDQLG